MAEGQRFELERTVFWAGESGKTQIYNDNSRGLIKNCTVAGIDPDVKPRTCNEESGVVIEGSESDTEIHEGIFRNLAS